MPVAARVGLVFPMGARWCWLWTNRGAWEGPGGIPAWHASWPGAALWRQMGVSLNPWSAAHGRWNLGRSVTSLRFLLYKLGKVAGPAAQSGCEDSVRRPVQWVSSVSGREEVLGNDGPRVVIILLTFASLLAAASQEV